jgi:hypothetical protein
MKDEHGAKSLPGGVAKAHVVLGNIVGASKISDNPLNKINT